MLPDGLDLPVVSVLPHLVTALADDTRARAAVLEAPPGAGKTTTVPLALASQPWVAGRRIMVLEPRRLATRAAARRMSDLVGEEVGGRVGYRTRDERVVSSSTIVEVVTEGILTRRLQHDPSLDGVAAVIFDEVHERNLQTDLGLALTLDVRGALRPDLRLVAMSATIDGDRFAALIAGAAGLDEVPVIRAEGRTFPLDQRWVPAPPRLRRPVPHWADVIRRALREAPGDVLVFLAGMGDQRALQRALEEAGPLRDADGTPVDVHLLHGSLSLADQDLALAPSPPGRRRVVLSTDIAETSLTVEGVSIVVDTGMTRVPRFDAGHGMTRLTTVPISRASADQRAGRAGRTGPGVAYRCWSKVEHGARRPHRDPEISQVDLAGLALELATWGADPADTSALAFIDPPPPRTMEEAIALLRMLGALDGHRRITERGRALSALPLHPRLAAMVVEHRDQTTGVTACALAALLDERDILRGRPDELPADLGVRLGCLAGTAHHPTLDRRARDRVARRATELARRARIDDADAPILGDVAGAVAAAGFPDRIAQTRGGAGRFRLRTGAGAWVPDTDTLAGAQFVVAADLDGKRSEARIRMGATLDPLELELLVPGDQITEHTALRWIDGDLVERSQRRLDRLDLGTFDRPPRPGPDTTEALVQRVRDVGLALVDHSDALRSLQARLEVYRWHHPGGAPDVSDKALRASVATWLPQHLPAGTGRRDLATVSLLSVAQAMVEAGAPGLLRRLDDLLPATLRVASGRRVPIRYDEGTAVMSVRPQELYGTTEHPTVLGGELAVTIELVSPAQRPIQVTSDLPGFWAGSWAAVRKEMASRYPKHDWPADPTTARPSAPGDRPSRQR